MLSTIRALLDILTPQERRRFYQMAALVFVLSVLEAGSVLSLLPFLQILSDPGLIERNGVLNWLYTVSGLTNERDFMWWLGIGVFLVTVFGLVMKALSIWIVTRFALMRAYSLSRRLLTGYLHQPYDWFLSRHSADLKTQVLNETNQIVGQVLLPACKLLPDIFVVVLLTLALVTVEPVVILVAALLLGVTYAAIYFAVSRYLYRIGVRRTRANQERFHAVQEATGGFKELKLMGSEEFFAKRFRDAAFQLAKLQTVSQVVNQTPRYALQAVAFGGMILLILMLLTREGFDVAAIVPTLGLIAAAGMKLLPALQQIYSNLSSIRFMQKTLFNMHKTFGELDFSRVEARDDIEAQPRIDLRENLRLEDVAYTYPLAERGTLSGISLKIAANTTVGIVGGSGAGKTTLIDIVLGLLDPQDGRLVIDGRTIGPQDLRGWQKSLGYVPQSIFIAADTIAANIAYGVRRDKIDMAAVERAARLANLHDFILAEMEQGYDTQVGEMGVRLSGGQRQRLGIARALYTEPSTLIFDEATSALDTLTEQAVMEAVAGMAGQKTIIMIAHRLSTIRGCDNIILLEQGQVAAEGTFDELVEKSAAFREMAAAG